MSKKKDETAVNTQDGEQSEGAGQTSEDQSGSTSQEAKTSFTIEDIKKAKSDAAAEAGREAAKAKSDAEAARAETKRVQEESKKSLDRLTALEKAKDEEELNSARNDPDRLSIYQQRQALRQQTADLAAREAKLAEGQADIKVKGEKYDAIERDATAQKLATEHGIDKGLLMTLAKTPEDMETVAKALAKATTSKAAVIPPKGDSGRTIGGASARYTSQQLEDMQMDAYGKLTDEQKKPIDTT